MLRLISRFFLLLGYIFLFFGFYLVYLRYSPKLLSFESKPPAIATTPSKAPQKIEIPSIKVELPIISAIKEGNKWETTHNGVSHLSSTPIPGQKGNSVLYGHNWGSLLADLPQIKPGQKVFVTFGNGKRQMFVVEYTAVVDPSESYIIDSTKDTRITIYTCTGFLDSKRFVVVAKPVG